MSDIEKKIAFKIPQQFPAIYREQNAELVQLVQDYYKFLETTPNQGVYNSRRMFEYRDITTTLESMIIFYQKKYLADLPLLEDASVRLVVKNILDLYRRKGSESGIILFFRMFYGEDVEINNPAKFVLKASDSKWQTGTYLQMVPNSGVFYARDGIKYYQYSDLLAKNIQGTTSGAKAAVDKINFIILNGTLTPILYLTNVRGSFAKYDNVMARIDGQDVSFGVINGSASDVIIDLDYGGTTGNAVGDEFKIQSEYGNGGEVVVTETEAKFTGIVDYTLTDGGFGYTIQNTKLEVTDQVLVLNNENLEFTNLERLIDTGGNIGTVLGQNASAVGIKMDVGDEFVINRAITTMDRTPNVTITGIFTVSIKNNSSPGALYPETALDTDVKVESLSNIETVNLITDLISPFLSVPLNSADYNANPPATTLMSGSASPVTLATPLDQAFNLSPFEIGTIDAFENVNPGDNYTNDVFTLVRDTVMIAFDRHEQVITLPVLSASFSVGDALTQPSSGVNGVITGIDTDRSFIKVRPYAYYGFDATPITHKGTSYDVTASERDYTSEKFGANADMRSKTQFATGRISAVKITNSGFGHLDDEIVYIVDDDGVKHAKGTLRADSQGITAGFWGSETSQINGYKPDGSYYDSRNKIHDSDLYQEFSYEILSTVDLGVYEETLKQNVHLAGTRLFGRFVYKNKVEVGLGHRFYASKKEDQIIGGPEIVGPNQPGIDIKYTSDRNTISVDTINLKADVV
jgi:hypothetical protein